MLLALHVFKWSLKTEASFTAWALAVLLGVLLWKTRDPIEEAVKAGVLELCSDPVADDEPDVKIKPSIYAPAFPGLILIGV